MLLAHSAQRRHVSPDSLAASPPSPSSQSPSPSLPPYPSQDWLEPFDTEDFNNIPSTLDLSYADLSLETDFSFDSRQSTPYDTTTSFPSASTTTTTSSDTQLMTDFPSHNPRLRVQQSTPQNRAELPYSPPPMSAGSQHPQAWNTYQDWSHLSPHAQQQQLQQQVTQQPLFSAHKRLSSESSVGSAGPASPYTQPAVFPQIVDTETQSVNSPHFDNFDHSYHTASQFAKPLPAYTNPLGNGSLFNQVYNWQPNADNAGQYIAQHSAMRQALRGQRGNGLGSRQQSLSTEQSTGGTAEYEGSARMHNAPSFDRSISEICQDELYNPSMQQSQPASSPQSNQPQTSQASLLSPLYRQTFVNDRLRAADAARSASPTSSLAREPSPFREDSEYASQDFAQHPSSPARISSARQIREAQKLQADAQAYKDHHPHISSHDFATSNTISPKEVSLTYHEAEDGSANFPLFQQPVVPVKQENAFAHRGQEGNEQYNAARSGPSSYPSSTVAPQANHPQFTFMPPSVPGTNVPNTYPFITHSRRQSSSLRSHNSDQVLEFPATLSSMESTKSESTPGEEMIRPPGFGSQPQSQSQSEPSSQEAQTTSSTSPPLPRPQDTSSNAGTYTCTAPSCTARFDNSAKLHKHRRDTHPSSMTITTSNSTAPPTVTTPLRSSISPYPGSASSPATPSSTSAATTSTNPQAAANNVSRNNQPGPHKCEKINPSTGKPCNTIFSRSYDLTRHEDTIHNNRKHKVRCHLCTEEKTFSRNDALTRHMRVVHPEVALDLGAKAGRRAGGRS